MEEQKRDGSLPTFPCPAQQNQIMRGYWKIWAHFLSKLVLELAASFNASIVCVTRFVVGFVLVAVVVKWVVAREGQKHAEARTQREKDLRRRIDPDLQDTMTQKGPLELEAKAAGKETPAAHLRWC